jgi:hypothetical protein
MRRRLSFASFQKLYLERLSSPGRQVLLSQDFVHACAADGAFPFERLATILHGDFHSILDFACGLAFHTISGFSHFISPSGKSDFFQGFAPAGIIALLITICLTEKLGKKGENKKEPIVLEKQTLR